MISFRYWQQRFGGDAGAIGRPVVVNGRTYTIIGVAPRGFFGTEVAAAPDFWFPCAMQPVIENGSPKSTTAARTRSSSSAGCERASAGRRRRPRSTASRPDCRASFPTSTKRCASFCRPRDSSAA